MYKAWRIVWRNYSSWLGMCAGILEYSYIVTDLVGQISPEALDAVDTTNTVTGHTDRKLPLPRIPSPPVALPFIHTITDVPTFTSVREDVFNSAVLADNLRDLSLGRVNRFFGKSSGVMLHQATLQLKHEYMTNSPDSFIPDFPPMRPVSNRQFAILS